MRTLMMAMFLAAFAELRKALQVACSPAQPGARCGAAIAASGGAMLHLLEFQDHRCLCGNCVRLDPVGVLAPS